MALFDWFSTGKSSGSRKTSSRDRHVHGDSTIPMMSPRRGRRMLRREQLFAVVRESLIRGGVLSTSYSFKVLTLDPTGDTFMVMVDLALPANIMPDDALLEIERWMQQTALARHRIGVRATYWRRSTPSASRPPVALKAAMAAQKRAPWPQQPLSAVAPPASSAPGALPDDRVPSSEEMAAFRRALEPQAAGSPDFQARHLVDTEAEAREADTLPPEPEAMSDFSSLSETQHGKL